MQLSSGMTACTKRGGVVTVEITSKITFNPKNKDSEKGKNRILTAGS